MLAQEYPVWLLCNLLVCAPSSYYYQPQGGTIPSSKT